ncbi:MAG: lauroyl acyltransferase [Rhodobacterales bacterium]|nr:MAG: lauroyl acyltransferase [Rhodobacterales bacterium]
MQKPAAKRRDYMVDLMARAIFRVMLTLPYRWRVPAMGWVMARIVAPLAGFRKRIRNNLAYVCPEMEPAQVKALCYQVPDNAGRSLIEIYSGDEFINRVKHTDITGPGAEAIAQAHSQGRPVVLAAGHFGNYDVARSALIARGYRIGAIYMPMRNPYYNRHYEAAISHIGTPLFSRDRKGLAEMVKFMRGGGMTIFGIDQYMSSGADLEFFGKPAPTALSAAKMALKLDALLVPINAIRGENGLDFSIVTEAPVAHSDAATMSQQMNDSLEQLVRAHMGQWFWIHNRWKPERQRSRAAAKTGP